MADSPKQDRKLGLPRTLYNGRWITAYDAELAARIVEKIAEGLLLKEICEPDSGFPHPTTFLRWAILYPELTKAYNAAIEFSARAFEEEAIEVARKVRLDPGSAQNVRAHQVLIEQLRWSSERRDPGRFGSSKQAVFRVPISINTSLNLGEVPGGSTGYKDVYNVTAKVIEDVPIATREGRPLLEKPRQEYDPKAPRKRVLVPHRNPFTPDDKTAVNTHISTSPQPAENDDASE